MNPVVFIPSAKLLPPELVAEFGALPSCLIPIHGRSALSHLTEQWSGLGYDVVVLAHEGVERIRDEAGNLSAVRVVDVGVTDSLGATLRAGLDAVGPEGPVAVNFGDTYIGDLPAEDDFACTAETVDSLRWTICKPQSERGLILRDKGERGCKSDFLALVGAFRFSDARTLGQQLEQALAATDAEVPVLDPFYVALRAYFDAKGRPPRFLAPVADWRDLGHLDTYFRSRREFGSGTRSFNSLEVDSQRGIVTKRSQDTQRLRQEIAWYEALPASVAHLAPRIFERSLDAEAPYVRMEYYSYPPLNELFLYGACDLGAWARIFSAIETTLEDLHAERRPTHDGHEARQARRAMYLDKTRQRLARVVQDDHLSDFWRDTIEINGRTCPGVPTLLESLPEALLRFGAIHDGPLSIIHGDFCGSNILFDRRNGIIRVIDPRGCFGGIPSYGDPLYDLAKLSHSILGGYDLLVAGQFHLDVSANGAMQLDVAWRPQHEAVQAAFTERLQAWSKGRAELVRLIESMLFLSMVPLHADRPESQRGFLARGVELYESVTRSMQ